MNTKLGSIVLISFTNSGPKYVYIPCVFFGILIRKLVSWDGSCIVPTILCYIRKECSNTGGLEATRIYEDWLFSHDRNGRPVGEVSGIGI